MRIDYGFLISAVSCIPCFIFMVMGFVGFVDTFAEKFIGTTSRKVKVLYGSGSAVLFFYSTYCFLQYGNLAISHLLQINMRLL